MGITIKDLTKNYGDIQALKEINLEIQKGIFGLLGPNGAGKTTLMRIIATLLPPTKGSVEILGHPLRDVREIRKILGYLPQEFGFYPQMTAYEVIDYIGVLNGLNLSQNQIMELLVKVDLAQKAKHKVMSFSGGMKRRLGIACTLINDPKVLIVDEPTAGLDPEARVDFRNLLAELGGDRVVILSTHIVADVESTCSRIAFIANGMILFEGSTFELIKEASGKVYSLRIDTSELKSYRERYRVVSVIHEEASILLRIISELPIEDGKSESPNLEDAYLYMVHKGG